MRFICKLVQTNLSSKTYISHIQIMSLTLLINGMGYTNGTLFLNTVSQEVHIFCLCLSFHTIKSIVKCFVRNVFCSVVNSSDLKKAIQKTVITFSVLGISSEILLCFHWAE
jgi:hypothetical protein